MEKAGSRTFASLIRDDGGGIALLLANAPPPAFRDAAMQLLRMKGGWNERLAISPSPVIRFAVATLSPTGRGEERRLSQLANGR